MLVLVAGCGNDVASGDTEIVGNSGVGIHSKLVSRNIKRVELVSTMSWKRKYLKNC